MSIEMIALRKSSLAPVSVLSTPSRTSPGPVKVTMLRKSPIRISALPAPLLQLTASFCRGEELRSFELINASCRKIFRNPANNRLWYVMLRYEMPSKDVLPTFSERLDYKALFTLFVVKIYRPKLYTGWMSRSFYVFMTTSPLHRDPQRNKQLKCEKDCCVDEEAFLYKTLFVENKIHEVFLATFTILKKTLGTRALYNGDGDRALWCRDCRSYVSLNHGTKSQFLANHTDCEPNPNSAAFAVT